MRKVRAGGKAVERIDVISAEVFMVLRLSLLLDVATSGVAHHPTATPFPQVHDVACCSYRTVAGHARASV